MANIPALIAANQKRWNVAKITRAAEFAPVAKRLVAQKARLQAMSDRTGVPWFVIAVIKERESGPDPEWLRNIAQGDPWNRASTHEPRGRGPFNSWEEAAYDALVRCPPYAGKWKDWSSGGMMSLLEQYNGLAYANAGRPSPYVWSGTDQYTIGKVLVDHGPIEPVVDKQLGCAGLILAMQAIDPTIMAVSGPAPIPAPQPIPPITPVPMPPQQNWLSAIVAALLSIFKRKG